MQPIGKLNRDIVPSDLPRGTRPYARNIVNSKVTGYPSNEDGFSSIWSDEPIVGRIVTNRETIIFSTSVDSIGSKITRYSHQGNFLSAVIDDALLGFRFVNPIEGVFEYNQKGQLVIAWWEGIGASAQPPRVLNLDCLPFDLNPDKSFINASDVDLLLLSPNFTNITTNYTIVGGSLPSGAIYVSVAYVFPDGSRTAYFVNDAPISIFSYEDSDHIHQISGATGGVLSNKGLRLTLTGLNPTYYGIKLGVVYSQNGVITAYESPVYKSPVSTITVQNLNNYIPTTLESILAPSISFKRVQTGDVLESKLYLANVETNLAPDIQPYINNVKVKWVATKNVELHDFDNNYKNPIFHFRGKAFKPNEVYALSLVATMITGEKYAYHLPGRDAQQIVGHPGYMERATIQSMVAGGSPPVNTTAALSINANSKYYQVYNTAKADGTMGFWENENETYPNHLCMRIFNAGGEVIGDLRNQKVRHHRFPNVKFLHANGVPYVTDNAPDVTTLFTLVPSGWNGAFRTYNVVGATDPSAGIHSSDNRRFTANRSLYMMIEIPLMGGSTGTFTFRYTFNGEVFENVYDSSATLYRLYVPITLNKGDYFEFIPSIVANTGAGSTITVKTFNLDTAEFDCSMLGITLEDLNIPANIRKQIAYLELGYAERDSNNSLIYAEGVIHPWRNNTISNLPQTVQTNFAHSFAFDLMNFKPTMSNLYLDVQLALAGDQPFISNALASANFLLKVNNHSYVPSTYPHDPSVGDDEQLSHLSLILDTTYPQLLPLDEIEPPLLVDFVRYATDVYIDYLNQRIVISGNRYSPNQSSIQNTYGGDVVTSLYGYHRAFQAHYDFPYFLFGRGREIYFHPSTSIANIGLRTFELLQWFPPKQLVMNEDVKYEELGIHATNTLNQKDNGSLYNKDFHALLNNLFPIIVNCSDTGCSANNGVYKTRIHQSMSNRTESIAIGWRVFEANAYYDNERNAGEIWALRVIGRTLLIHHTDGLFELTIRDRMQADQFDIVLGKADLFEYAVRPVTNVSGGYLGCQHKWASTVIPDGYVFWDYKDRKLYLFNINEAPKELSADGMYNFFQDNSVFQEAAADNPFTGTGFHIGYDDRNKRILLTRIERYDKGVGGTLEGKGWTHSYSLINGYEGWLAEHDYLPSTYMWTRENIWAVDNNVVVNELVPMHGVLYLMNIRTKKGTYFQNNKFATFVEVVINPRPGISKKFIDVVWRSVVKHHTNTNIYEDKTFTTILVWNNNKSTGLRPITENRILPINANSALRSTAWSFNDMRNRANSLPIITNSRGDVISYPEQAWTKMGPIEGSHIVVRFYYDNIDEHDITLLDVNANIVANKSGNNQIL